MNTKISEACERCGRCRQGDFANCKNARNLAEASRDALPFVAYAYSQGIEGAEEAGRAVESALEDAPLHPQPAELAEQQGGGSLNTSEGGRRYVADFFARELRRHDFTRYITTTLAADFACALAQHLAATGKQQVGEVHPDDLAVDAFADAMKQKMASARAKGRGGWEDPAQCSAVDLTRLLRDHVEKGDPRDVANFCMMLHQRGESIISYADLPYMSKEEIQQAEVGTGRQAALAATGKQQVGEVQGDALPPMPSPAYESVSECGPDYFDASQMRQYALTALAAHHQGEQAPVGYMTAFGFFAYSDFDAIPVGTQFYTAPPAQGIDLDATQGMVAEYQLWIDFYHAGDGDYGDFLRKHVLTADQRDAAPGVGS